MLKSRIMIMKTREWIVLFGTVSALSLSADVITINNLSTTQQDALYGCLKNRSYLSCPELKDLTNNDVWTRKFTGEIQPGLSFFTLLSMGAALASCAPLFTHNLIRRG